MSETAELLPLNCLPFQLTCNWAIKYGGQHSMHEVTLFSGGPLYNPKLFLQFPLVYMKSCMLFYRHFTRLRLSLLSPYSTYLMTPSSTFVCFSFSFCLTLPCSNLLCFHPSLSLSFSILYVDLLLSVSIPHSQSRTVNGVACPVPWDKMLWSVEWQIDPGSGREPREGGAGGAVGLHNSSRQKPLQSTQHRLPVTI